MGLLFVLLHFVAHDSPLFFSKILHIFLLLLFFSDFTTPAQYDYKVDQPNRPFLFRMRLVIVTCPPRPPVSVSFIRRCIGGVQYGSGTWWLCVLPLYPDGVFQFLNVQWLFFYRLLPNPWTHAGPWLRLATPNRFGLALIFPCLFFFSMSSALLSAPWRKATFRALRLASFL